MGRLDLETSGLLLWTTDGTLLHRLTHPRYRVPRAYQAALDRPPTRRPPSFTLDDGHRPDIVSLDPLPLDRAHPGLDCPPETADLRAITIMGGKFHEVRRIFARLGSRVLGLCRVAYGELILPDDLKPGAYQEVDATSLVAERPSGPAQDS